MRHPFQKSSRSDREKPLTDPAGAEAEKGRGPLMRRFEAAMAVMGVIPLLGLFYLLARVSGLRTFTEERGIIAFAVIALSISGMLLARSLVAGVVRRLDETRRDLDRASRAKTGILRAVVHETATPLMTLTLNLESIRDGECGGLPEAIKAPVHSALRQCERLVKLVQDLTDISMIERGILTMERKPVNLTAVMKEAIETVLPAEKAARVRLGAVGAVREIAAADRHRLGQVLVNLLRNAVKYSPPDTEIAVEIVDRGSFYEMRVADRGDGVPEEQKRRIFEPFVRASRREVHGLGLGLAISRHIIAAHGGRLWVEDRPGGGSVFAFSVPKAGAPSRGSDAPPR